MNQRPGPAPRLVRRKGGWQAAVLAAALILMGLPSLVSAKPAPWVGIVAPEEGLEIGTDVLDVSVEFRAAAHPTGRAGRTAGMVSTIVLEVDGEQVGVHDNPPANKVGVHTFTLDLSGFPEGPLLLQAHAFQGHPNAGLRGSSSPVTVVLDRRVTALPATVSGTVSDDSGHPLDGAMVTAYGNGQQLDAVPTDGDGRFLLVVPVDRGPISLVARPPEQPLAADDLTDHRGLGSATEVLRPLAGGDYDLHLVLWSELPLVVPGEVSESPFDTVTLTTPDSSVIIAGLPKDLGIVGGSARAFSPTLLPHAFPGEFATRQEGLESGLFSAGFASVNLLQRDDAGQLTPLSALQDAQGDPVEVELRFRIDRADWPAIQDGAHHRDLPSHVQRHDRIDVPLYAFDEEQGDWTLTTEFGWLEDSNGPIPPSQLPAIHDGSHPLEIFMTGLVDHFSWYNLDFPTHDACMSGRVVDGTGAGLAHVLVTFTAAPGSSSFSNVVKTTTDGDGRFQVLLPRSEVNSADDWNGNGKIDGYAVIAEVGASDGVSVFGGPDGFPTAKQPAADGCDAVPDLVVKDEEKKKAKRVTFELTFLDAEHDAPLFVTPPSFAFPDYAQATLYDLAVPVGSTLWQQTCGLPCNPQSSTDDKGVARITIPVLDRDLPHLEHLSGSFAYHQLRPDLGLGAWEFASGQYAVAANKKKETIKLAVQRRGPPTITTLEPDATDTYLFDEQVPLKATGTDLSGNSLDHLEHNFLWWSTSARTTTLAVQRVASVLAGATFGSGAHTVTVYGIDSEGWLGASTVDGFTVATVEATVTPTTLDLVPGDTGALGAAVAGANDQTVTWSSDEPTVASVNAAGEVTAVAAGTATIVARSAVDPTKTATATVTVANLTAAFTVTPGSGDTTTSFALDASASVGDISAFAWDLGDGTIRSGQTETHTYSAAGTYTVTLTVTSASGATAQTTRSIDVADAGANVAPVASFTASPTSGNPGVTTAFDASASSDPDGTIVAWDWNFGDGTAGTGQTVSHTYNDSGNFTVDLTVTDDDGATGTATLQIKVNHPPVAAFTLAPDGGRTPLEVTVNASGAQDHDGQIERYAWDFGDGTPVVDGGVVETHVYTEPGTYTITLTVEDDGGLSDHTTHTVIATAAAAGFTATILADDPYLTYLFDASELYEPSATFTWDFGDGTGTAPDPNRVTTTHRYRSPGSFAVTLRVDHSDGRTVEARRTVEVAHSEFDHAVAIAASRFHSLAVADNGTVWGWGRNQEGQLGNGTTLDSGLPTRASDLDDVVAVTAGLEHSLALARDGTVWAFGKNRRGQLGDGTSIDRAVPVRVNDLDDAIAIAAGRDHSLALDEGGTVWAWGRGGQLGDGTRDQRSVPGPVIGLPPVVAIAAGNSHSLALGEDGTVWAWGENAAGQLGDGTDNHRRTPVRVSGLTHVAAIAGGVHHSLAVADDGTAWGWGANSLGQLGDGTTVTWRTAPVQVSDLTDVVAIAGGRGHSLAVLSDDTIKIWGSRAGTTVPVAAGGPDEVAAIAAGSDHWLALTYGGTVWAGTSNFGTVAIPIEWWD